MSTITNYEEMEVWQKSMNLITNVYQITKNKSFLRDYSLVNQIRRSAISIASNIAEGFERDGNKELINFLYIAKGSCGELKCQLQIARNLAYIESNRFEELYNLANLISKSLGGLIKYLQNSDLKGKKYK
ncbi:MAG: four helix bundle protein [Bacteroidales bacterium]|jgi:four helix bundle protein|nr:four helix bundle protein [Bacteroidales bacterium]